MLFKVEKKSLLEVKGKQRLEGYVVFGPGRGQWWQRFLKNGYGHASLVIRQGPFYIWIEPSMGFTEARVFAIGTRFSELFPNHTQIVKFTRWRDKEKYRTPHILMPFTCIEQIKAFLGIQNALLFTPWQLCKHLTED